MLKRMQKMNRTSDLSMIKSLMSVYFLLLLILFIILFFYIEIVIQIQSHPSYYVTALSF